MEYPPEKKSRPKFFRKNYLIYPRVQLSIVLYLVMIFWLSMSILYAGLVRTLTIIDDKALLGVGGSQEDFLVQLHLARISSLNEFFIGFMLIATIAMIFGGIFLSHRIVGPIFRIRRILEQWVQGQKPYPINCRGEDFFQELFPMIEKLVKKDFGEYEDT